ncbi:MAG: hypothetical protein OEO79_17605 [Gemmatimonadota bacterium]|nr:hypothetical protein [Gemmatimonadota bacterium]
MNRRVPRTALFLAIGAVASGACKDGFGPRGSVTVSGVVVSAVDGSPLPGVSVSITAHGFDFASGTFGYRFTVGSAVSDATGVFSLRYAMQDCAQSPSETGLKISAQWPWSGLAEPGGSCRESAQDVVLEARSLEEQLPRMVDGGRAFRSLAASGTATCGIDVQGDLYCWGYGFPLASEQWAPTLVAQGPYSDVVLGIGFGCVLDGAGQVFCWGSNSWGNLGIGSTEARSVPSDPVAGGVPFTAISASEAAHVCALDADGLVYCWGANDLGQLGSAGGNLCGGTTNCARQPIVVPLPEPASQVAVHDSNSCALLASGLAYCWGGFAPRWGPSPTAVAFLDGASALHPTGAGRVCAVQATGAFVCDAGDGPMLLDTGSSILLAAATSSRACGVTSSDSVLCWSLDSGSLLTHDFESAGLGFDRLTLGSGAYSGPGFSSSPLATWHACGITGSGDTYCWGHGPNGQLGYVP